MWFIILNNYRTSKSLVLRAYKKLTPKGNEIRLKLTGLKLFLKDYSIIKSRELKEIKLWDEYMIYSVILNDNRKVQKEILKMAKRQFKSRG